MNIETSRGQILLPTVLVLGFLVMTIGLVGLFIVSSLNRANYAIRLSTNALAAAESGVQDGQLKIIRGVYSSYSTACSTIYTLNLQNNSADVCIYQPIDPTCGGCYFVDSVGRAGNQMKKLRGIFDSDLVTKQLRVRSINEIQL